MKHKEYCITCVIFHPPPNTPEREKNEGAMRHLLAWRLLHGRNAVKLPGPTVIVVELEEGKIEVKVFTEFCSSHQFKTIYSGEARKIEEDEPLFLVRLKDEWDCHLYF